jgi:hypothetical protein
LFIGYEPNLGFIKSSREVDAFLVSVAEVDVEFPTTINPESDVVAEVLFEVGVPSFVEVAEELPPKIESIETVADAREDNARGTTLTIPILKKTSINNIAPITIIRSSVFIYVHYITMYVFVKLCVMV